METIEIRQNRKKLIPMLALLLAGLLGATYTIFFSGKFGNNNTVKLLYGLLSIPLAYVIYRSVKKVIKNEAVLTFSKSEVQIKDKDRPVSFLWLQVIDWKIEKDKDEGTSYLIIETSDKAKKINISWLDKSPAEIERLLQLYKAR